MSSVQIDALNSALAGLSVAKARIDTLSRNISNAGSENYSRKIQGQSTVGGLVQIGEVSRSVDDSVTQQLRQISGETARLTVTVKTLSSIESALGNPNQNTGLSAAVTKLQNAFNDLSVSPQKNASYGAVTVAADNVALAFRTTWSTIETQRTNAQSQLVSAVADVNRTLQEIASANEQIRTQNFGDITDVQDQRDQLLTKLQGLMEVTTFAKPDGEVAVYTKTGVPLVDATVKTLDPAELGATQPASGPPLIIVRSGTIGGLLALRDQTLPAAESQLDDQARAITAELKNVGVELFNDGGSTTLATAPVNPLQIAGYAGRIAVNQVYRNNPPAIRDGNSVTPLAPGDTTFIDAALNVFARTDIPFTPGLGLPATGGLAQVATDFVAAQGTARAATQDQLDQQTTLQKIFSDKQSQVSGVNIDDELAQLVQLQQTYSANARVITTTKTLLDDLLHAVQV